MIEADSSSCVSSTSSPQQSDEKSAKSPDSTKNSRKFSCDDRPEQSNKLSSSTNTKTSHPPKICGVCGDFAKSFHFGGLSCDSCKAFFRRSVHGDAFASFRCAYGGKCTVDKSSRKGCQYCRFQKCLSIGMERKWVMGEDERLQLKLKKEKKSEEQSTASSIPATTPITKEYEPDVSEMLKYLTVAEKDEIECLVNKYQHSYREIPFRVSNCQGSRNTIEIIQMFTTILRRFAYFTKLLPEFTELSIPDQSRLLRASVLEMCLLRGALSFDLKNNRWPAAEKLTFLQDCPQLRVEDMQKLVSKDLYDMHMQFIKGMQELGADEPTVTILLLVVLFYPERGTPETQQYISQVQEKYLLLLRKYVLWRYGPKGSNTFPKLLTKLADLRQLNDSHTEYNLRMTKTEVERIQEQLGNLNLNPYPQWVLVEDQLNRPCEFVTQNHDLPQENFGVQNLATQGNLGYSDQGMPANIQHMQANGQPRDLFIQFVNRKIPALINNPFTQFPMENEIAYGMSHLHQYLASGPGITTTHQEMNDPTSTQGIVQFRDMLEASDPDALRRLKESLSPDVLAKLQSIFGTEETGGYNSESSRLPHEFTSYLTQYQNSGEMTSTRGGQLNQEFVELGAGSSPFLQGLQQDAYSHPMASYTETQLTDHFTSLQQNFRNPNYYLETLPQESGYYQHQHHTNMGAYNQQQYYNNEQ